MIALLALGACSTRTKPAPPDAATAPRVSDGRAQATSSLRCEECHARISRDWTDSPHANAVKDPVYLKMIEDSDDNSCVDCHAPLRGAVAAADPLAREGIGCDACHLVEGLIDGEGVTPRFRWAAHGATKFGPLCGAEDHYFHKMGCSKVHGAASFCAPCHEWRRGTLPVLTDWSDWKAGGKADEGLECQSCHMPSIDDEIARGGKRLRLHDHRFAMEQLGEAALTVTSGAVDGRMRLQILNSGAGHALPAGMPERRLVVRLRSLDAHGAELAREQHEYGRVLVDDAGRVAPFLRATRVARDQRILPGKFVTIEVTPPAAATQLEVTLAIASVASELVGTLGRGSEQALQMLRLPLGGKKK